MKAAIAVRRERRPGGGPERSEGIAVSPKGVKAGSIFAIRFNAENCSRREEGRKRSCVKGYVGSPSC